MNIIIPQNTHEPSYQFISNKYDMMICEYENRLTAYLRKLCETYSGILVTMETLTSRRIITRWDDHFRVTYQRNDTKQVTGHQEHAEALKDAIQEIVTASYFGNIYIKTT